MNSFSKYPVIIALIITFFSGTTLSFSQEMDEDSVYYSADLPSVKIVRPNSTYAFYLKRVQKLYPYALYASEVIFELDDDLAELNKKRHRKKTSKERQKQLFNEFNYMVKDLYTSEGQLLMKLIHRETGLTVDEIIRKYRGKLQASVYTTMAKMFTQDLKITYDAKGKDRLIEKIIRDIDAETVYFDPVYKKVSKEDYKISMKEYRAAKKERRKKKKKKKVKS